MAGITILTITAMVGILGSAAYVSPWFWRYFRMNRIQRKLEKERILVLTYDDGPSPLVTAPLLELLHRRGVRATFFMLGCHAQRYPQLVDEVVKGGHDVACHSDRHVNALKSMPWTAAADISGGYRSLSPWIPSNAMYRPPFGKMTLPTYFSIRQRRAPVWWWTIDSGDTHSMLPSVEDVVQMVRERAGGIVLMHDGSMNERQQYRSDFVVKLTEALLDLADRDSLRIAPLRDLAL